MLWRLIELNKNNLKNCCWITSTPLENFIDMSHVYHLCQICRKIEVFVIAAFCLQHGDHFVSEVVGIKIVHWAEFHLGRIAICLLFGLWSGILKQTDQKLNKISLPLIGSGFSGEQSAQKVSQLILNQTVWHKPFENGKTDDFSIQTLGCFDYSNAKLFG